jgi:hypothetical protein
MTCRPAGSNGDSISPGVDGGTNWQNPAFDPKRQLIFVPATDSGSVFTKLSADRVTRGPNGYYVGSGSSQAEPADP